MSKSNGSAAPDSDSTMPSISIVVPNYNSGATLRQTLQSLVDQDYPALEIIVIDGGSSDESLDVIREFESHLAYWECEKDRGQSHAINKGFSRCTGEVVNWLCSDDWLCDGALHAVGAVFRDDCECDVVVGRCRLQTDDESWSKILVPKALELLPCQNNVPQPSCFYKRSLLTRKPALREDLHYAMDLELWMYFQSHSARWRCIEYVLSVYVHSGENKTSVGGAKMRREFEKVYCEYTTERIPLTFWHRLLLLPLDHLRCRMPGDSGERWVRPLRILIERILGKFYGFPRVHAMDWGWTIKP